MSKDQPILYIKKLRIEAYSIDPHDAGDNKVITEWETEFPDTREKLEKIAKEYKEKNMWEGAVIKQRVEPYNGVPYGDADYCSGGL